ncbi:MAG TPA: glycine--tRNA ligase subunit beta [Candidatus Eisenbacteria bacterium]
MAETLLLEIGCEEIPASYIGPALSELESLARAGLSEARVGHGAVAIAATPRRLALLIEGITDQGDRVLDVLGPPVSVAFDASGRPTPAAQGFAKKVGLPLESIGRKPGGKGADVLHARVHEKGKPAAEVLPALVEAWIGGIHFPKTMQWNGRDRFARPVRWIVALLGDRILPVKAFGLSAGRKSRGHRIHAPGWFEVGKPGGYVGLLRERVVMVDRSERLRTIRDELARAGASIGGAPVEDPELLEEVADLVEWPEAVVGSFDASYLALPRPVIVTAMRAHQRYFAVEAKDGSLLPSFVMIRSGRGEGAAEIRRGTQAVLRARLEDARFYWDNDRKGGLEAKVEALRGIVWHERLGTVHDRTMRIVQITEDLARTLAPKARAHAARAAYLCKADLASEMVRSGKEFAALQGIIGAEYAAASGEDAEVARAIREHYLPQGPSDPLPGSMEGTLVSLADRLEAIVGAFRAGLEVSGSQDPYGLRRAGNGIVRILLEKRLRFDAIEKAAWVDGLFEKAGIGRFGSASFQDFWAQRVESALSDAGVPHDTAAAVLAVRPGDPLDVLARARAVDEIRRSDDFEGLMVGYRRAANLLRSASPEDVAAAGQPMAERAENFGEKAEADLHLETKMTRQAVETYLQADAPDYGAALKHLLGLRPSIDAFFEAVMVMVDDPATRRRRLALLDAVRRSFLRIADFSALPTAPGQKSV